MMRPTEEFEGGNMSNCVNCGSKLEDGAYFCTVCGTKAPEQKTAAEQKTVPGLAESGAADAGTPETRWEPTKEDWRRTDAKKEEKPRQPGKKTYVMKKYKLFATGLAALFLLLYFVHGGVIVTQTSGWATGNIGVFEAMTMQADNYNTPSFAALAGGQWDEITAGRVVVSCLVVAAVALAIFRFWKDRTKLPLLLFCALDVFIAVQLLRGIFGVDGDIHGGSFYGYVKQDILYIRLPALIMAAAAFCCTACIRKGRKNALDEPESDANAASFGRAFAAEIAKAGGGLERPDAKTKSAADELRKYKELLDSGAITAEEYEDMKKKLLKF